MSKSRWATSASNDQWAARLPSGHDTATKRLANPSAK